MAEGTVLEFKADLEGFSRALNRTVAQAVKYVALRIDNGVIEKMPVKSGRARGSVGMSLDSPGDYELPEGEYGDEEGASLAREQQRVLDELTEENPFREVWVFDNLPYIEPLENGHSQQAPLGMFAVTLAEVGAEIDAQLEAIAQENLK